MNGENKRCKILSKQTFCTNNVYDTNHGNLS